MKWAVMRGTFSSFDGEFLRTSSLQAVMNEVLNPLDASQDNYHQLQKLFVQNKEEYKRRIRLFPFIKCGHFNPRKSVLENFTSISCFVIHVGNLNGILNVEELRSKIKSDTRTLMLYQSPSGNGINVFFGLSEPCYDAGHFYYFYLKFSKLWADEYGLAGRISKNAAQVNYRCYLSYDPECYYNSEPILINWVQYLQLDKPAEEIHTIKESLPIIKEETTFDADEQALGFIHKKLGIRSKNDKKKEEKKAPIDLALYMFSLFELYAKHDIKVQKTERMTFGNKVTLSKGKAIAHIKIYTGQERVIAQYAPYENTHTDFCEECKKLTQNFFNSKIEGNESD